MSESKAVTVNFGGGLGVIIAGTLSALKWGGFWLTIGHALLSWIYVVYFVLKYTPIRHFFGF